MKSEQNQRQRLIVDIAANRCLVGTIELKLFCFNKTPKWKYFSQNPLIASLDQVRMLPTLVGYKLAILHCEARFENHDFRKGCSGRM